MHRLRILLFFLGLSCLAAVSRAEQAWQLYDDSEVARVDISCDPGIIDWLYQSEHLESDSLHPATIHFRNALIDEDVLDVGFRLRGNTSRNARKKSFKLSFNEFVSGREWYDVDKLNLNGEHNDPSIVRSKLCWDLFQQVDLPATRASHCEVWINGEFFGLYISVEHIDDEFLWKHFEDDSGNLWKCLWPADLGWRGPDIDSYKWEENGRRTYELKTNEEADDYSKLYELIRLLHQCPDEAIEDSLGQFLDVEGVLEYFAICVLTGSWDNYWFLMNNFYLYHDPSADRMTLIPYDFDNSFSVDWFGIDWALRDPYSFGNDSRPLAERILERPRWRNLYTHMLAHWNELLLDEALWQERLTELHNRIYPFAVTDSFRTLDYGYTLADFSNSWGPFYQDEHVRRGLRDYLDTRRSSLNGMLNWVDSGPEAWRLEATPKRPLPGDSIHVVTAAFSHLGAPQVSLRWRVGSGAWQEQPMVYAGDPLSPRLSIADRFETTLAPVGISGSLELQVQVRDTNDRARLYPPLRPVTFTIQPAPAGIAVNEFLASNDSQGQDPAGEFDDWVELFNSAPEPLPLAGHHLSDDPDDLTRWSFPPDTPDLLPGEFLLVWCDEDDGQAGYHASFKLSAGGEFLALTGPDGSTVLDSLSFSAQSTDISQGRVPDGTGGWQFLPPSPGMSNEATGIELPEGRPEAFEMRAWPNPFNGSLIVSLPPETTTLRLYNLSGRRLRTLKLDGITRSIRLGAGTWTDQPAGIYLLVAKGASTTTRTKVMYLK